MTALQSVKAADALIFGTLPPGMGGQNQGATIPESGAGASPAGWYFCLSGIRLDGTGFASGI